MQSSDKPAIMSAEDVERALGTGGEIAIIDVREAGEFAAGHLFFSSSVPLSVFEACLPDLVPSTSCRLVVLDDGHSGRAERAAKIARSFGHEDVHVLDGGCAAWRAGGRELFEGVFVPSKAFGEVAEHALHVPSITPAELAGWISGGKDVVILDGRPFEEHRKMNIPGSICLPNGELALRATSIVPDDKTPIVVHCAGRTRSIVGAQILRETGIRNPVYALENGTQGWVLAGLNLEKGSTRSAEASVPLDDSETLTATARHRAAEWNVPFIDAVTCGRWLSEPARTTYLLDVRSHLEYAAGHPQGAIHAPGGQLLQSTDSWLAVRGARVVLVDDTGLRAVTVGRWLRLMGWDVHVLTGGLDIWGSIAAPRRRQPDLRRLPLQAPDPRDLPVILDLRPSMTYRAGHIRSARWVLRPMLADAIAGLGQDWRIGLCGRDEAATWLVAGDLKQAGFHRVEWYGDDPAAWAAGGCELVSTPDMPDDAAAIDFVFFTHDRHSGNLDAARTYLAWETGLVGRLNPLERRAFRL